MHLRDWGVAQQRARKYEAEGITSDVVPQNITEVCKKFLQDATTRGLRESSLRKYRQVLKQLEVFSQDKGYIFLPQFGVEELRAFRGTWKNRNLSARNKLEHIKAFFRFCQIQDRS